VDVVLYNHTIGKSPVTSMPCLASPLNRHLGVVGPDKLGTGLPMQALPLLTDWENQLHGQSFEHSVVLLADKGAHSQLPCGRYYGHSV
jgi:hypothetical protein